MLFLVDDLQLGTNLSRERFRPLFPGLWHRCTIRPPMRQGWFICWPDWPFSWELVEPEPFSLRISSCSSSSCNNINHPNDFGHWIYFEALQATGL